MFEETCKKLREELKTVREENDRLQGLLDDMVPRSELNAPRKVCVYAYTCVCVCVFV